MAKGNGSENIVSINLNIRGIKQSPTLAINAIRKKLEAKGQKVYDFGLGQSPFPVPDPIVESLRNHAHEKDYLSVYGLEALRKSVAQFHRTKDQVDIRANNVLIGPGSKELMFILKLVYYGDIILPTPCWVSYVPQAKIIGRNIKFIHTSYQTKWRITAEQLVDYLKTENDQYKPRLLVLTYPSNPDGGTYSVEEIKKLAKVARKYKLIILSDEIYGLLHYKGEHISIARFYPEATIISSGLSKWCGAGGWRLGTFSFPTNFDWLKDAMAAVASETYTSVSAPIQYAAIKAFQGGPLIEEYLFHVRRILEYIGKKSAKILKESGIKVHSPDGAYYLFADFEPLRRKLNRKGIENNIQLSEKLLNEASVASLPGEAFQRPANELTIRLSLVDFDGGEAIKRSKELGTNRKLPGNFATEVFSDFFAGVERITTWANK